MRARISLDKHDYVLAKKEARALGMSTAEFVRRAVKDKLIANRNRPWMRYIGMVESGDTRSSRSIDDVVYGAKD